MCDYICIGWLGCLLSGIVDLLSGWSLKLRAFRTAPVSAEDSPSPAPENSVPHL